MPTPTASGTVSTFAYSGVNDLDALLNGDMTKWGESAAQAATVTYSFPASEGAWMNGYGNEVTTANFLALSATQQAAAENALTAWSAVANISFQKIVETPTSVGDIRIAFSYAVGDEAWGYSFYPGEEAYAGDIWINRKTTAEATFTPGDYDYESLIHEIGHAIGLKHPGNYNAGGGGSEGPFIASALDKTNFTIMSYTEPEWGSVSPQAPGVYDILALQYLYGANTTTNAGDTNYAFTPSSPAGLSIWDVGGIDTIDASAYLTAINIDLREGHYSDIGLTDNIGIAFDVTLENARGGAGADILTGNETSNTLTGNGGSDKFVFLDNLDAGSNVDHITDFASGTDKLYLGKKIFSSLTSGTPPGALQFVAFDSGNGESVVSAATLNSYLLFDGSTGSLYYDGDAGGSGVAVKFAILDGLTSLSASDFYIFESVSESGSDEEIYDGGSEIGDDSDNYLEGGEGDDYFWCDAGNDTAEGSGGNDYMHGGDDRDLLDGGAGDDDIYGADGNDTLAGGNGDDYAEGEEGNDSIAGGTGNDLLGGGEDTDKLEGGEGDDEIYGDEGNDQLIGGEGDDTLDGGEGGDKMTGGNGDDAYFVDSKKDVVTEKPGQGSEDAVISNIDYTLGKGIEFLFLYGDGDRTGKGNTGDNFIVGSDNNDRLYGKEGNDEIEGGGGADDFYFDTRLNASTNVDSITDFVSGEDSLHLVRKIFSAFKATGTIAQTDLATFDSSTGDTLAAATGNPSYFIYDGATGDIYYDKDRGGSAAAIKFVTLVGAPELAASDLLIV